MLPVAQNLETGFRKIKVRFIVSHLYGEGKFHTFMGEVSFTITSFNSFILEFSFTALYFQSKISKANSIVSQVDCVWSKKFSVSYFLFLTYN